MPTSLNRVDDHSRSDQPARNARPRRLIGEIAIVFTKLGLLSFGGPVAHLGYLQNEFVDRRKWLSDSEYAELVALCQFLPGPASSQAVFAIGMMRAGVWGAIVASNCFTLPSAILMILFAYGVTAIADLARSGWVHGLKLAAVAIVAHAVWQMGRRLCPDATRITLAGIAAGVVICVAGSFVQVATIGTGAFAGWLLLRSRERTQVREQLPGVPISRRQGALVLVIFAVLLILLPVLARTTGSRTLSAFDSFYRTGSLVFGGGHVVLPLLRQQVVPRGWVDDEQFLAGYGAAQALPGPLFTFAGYLGTVISDGTNRWMLGVVCLAGIFLPGWLLISGALPYWQRFRQRTWAQAAMDGANAAVVGLLLAALWRPLIVESVHDWRDAAAVIVAFGLLSLKAPAIGVVLGLASAGQWLLTQSQA